MKGIIWLWKHRHCWKGLKQLYEGAPEIRRNLRLAAGNLRVTDQPAIQEDRSVSAKLDKTLEWL